MRTREEITNDVENYIDYTDLDFLNEVLLDIRDLLVKLSTPPPTKSPDAPVE